MAGRVIQINNRKKSGNGLFYAMGALGTAFAVDYWLSTKKMEDELKAQEEEEISMDKAKTTLKNIGESTDSPDDEPPAPLEKKQVDEISHYSNVDDFSEGELDSFLPEISVSNPYKKFEPIQEEPHDYQPTPTSGSATPSKFTELSITETTQVVREQVIEVVEETSIRTVESSIRTDRTVGSLSMTVQTERTAMMGEESVRSIAAVKVQEDTPAQSDEEPAHGTLMFIAALGDEEDLETIEREIESLEKEIESLDEEEEIVLTDGKSFAQEFMEQLPIALWKLLLIVALALAWQYARPNRGRVIPEAQQTFEENTKTEEIPMLGQGTEDATGTAVAVAVDELQGCKGRREQTNSLGELTFSWPQEEEEHWGIFAVIVLAMMIL